jgi:hypothetical protein
MDISVSRLNHRLALQLPVELPLGLVFVVGALENLASSTADADNGADAADVWFELVEEGYRLRCQAGKHALSEFDLSEGVRIRAGGHLMFDAQQAGYFLLARDIELAPLEAEASLQPATTGGRTALSSILADVKRRAEAAQVLPADLPDWVQKMAPPEIQAEAALAEAERAETAELEMSSDESATITPPLDEALVSFLTTAMEGTEEIELTPEVVEEMSPGSAARQDKSPKAPLNEIPAPLSEERVADRALPAPMLPPNPNRETDWLVILLILSFFILTIAIIVASALWLLR